MTQINNSQNRTLVDELLMDENFRSKLSEAIRVAEETLKEATEDFSYDIVDTDSDEEHNSNFSSTQEIYSSRSKNATVDHTFDFSDSEDESIPNDEFKLCISLEDSQILKRQLNNSTNDSALSVTCLDPRIEEQTYCRTRSADKPSKKKMEIESTKKKNGKQAEETLKKATEDFSFDIVDTNPGKEHNCNPSSTQEINSSCSKNAAVDHTFEFSDSENETIPNDELKSDILKRQLKNSISDSALSAKCLDPPLEEQSYCRTKSADKPSNKKMKIESTRKKITKQKEIPEKQKKNEGRNKTRKAICGKKESVSQKDPVELLNELNQIVAKEKNSNAINGEAWMDYNILSSRLKFDILCVDANKSNTPKSEVKANELEVKNKKQPKVKPVAKKTSSVRKSTRKTSGRDLSVLRNIFDDWRSDEDEE